MSDSTDIYSSEKRSEIMSRVRTKHTKPELRVRSVLHRMGYRFRLHRKDLPGNPDIVMPKYKTAIFVHGCFWHRHPNCKRSSTPVKNAGFWQDKFEANLKRDEVVEQQLIERGWNVLVIWECEALDSYKTAEKIKSFLLGLGT